MSTNAANGVALMPEPPVTGQRPLTDITSHAAVQAHKAPCAGGHDLHVPHASANSATRARDVPDLLA
jgi:hypothetical protein